MGNDGAIFLYWFGFLVNFFFFRIKDWMQGKKREDFYRNHPKAKVHIKLLLIRVALATGVIFPLYLMLKFAIMAGLNTAIVNSLISGSALFTAIIFYFAFQEKLSKQHMFGMVLLITAAALISFSKEEKVIESKSEVSFLIPVFLALCCCLFYAAGSWVVRTVHELKTITTTQFISDAFFVYSFVLIAFSLIWEFFVQSYTNQVIFWAFLTSVFNIIAAVMIGKAVGI